VDWTGRAVRDDKRGAIPTHIQPIFKIEDTHQMLAPHPAL